MEEIGMTILLIIVITLCVCVIVWLLAAINNEYDFIDLNNIVDKLYEIIYFIIVSIVNIINSHFILVFIGFLLYIGVLLTKG